MRTMIAIPCMDMVQTDFFRSCVGMDTEDDLVQWTTCQSSLVYDARNKLTDMAIEGDFDRVLWLDSDVVFDRHLYRRLSEHLDMGKEMVSGLYFGRKPNYTPVIYKRCESELRDGRLEPAIALLDKYSKPYDVVYTNFVGTIVYEDDWQIAVKVDDGKMV